MIGANMNRDPKPLFWVGDSKERLSAFPKDVREVMGYALFLAQIGAKHPEAKPLKGFGGAGVLEVVEDFNGNAYRAVYTLKVESAVYVLHAFQKKSRKGIKTNPEDIEAARRRLEEVLKERGG